MRPFLWKTLSVDCFTHNYHFLSLFSFTPFFYYLFIPPLTIHVRMKGENESFIHLSFTLFVFIFTWSYLFSVQCTSLLFQLFTSSLISITPLFICSSISFSLSPFFLFNLFLFIYVPGSYRMWEIRAFYNLSFVALSTFFYPLSSLSLFYSFTNLLNRVHTFSPASLAFHMSCGF